MPDTTGSLIRHAARAACLVIAFALAAAAQQPDQPVATPAPDAPEFLPRYDFHMAISTLGSGDIRFSWDTHFGGSFDVVDYKYGRLGVLVNYEAVLGDELRIFDPDQGNYTLEANASGRVDEYEIAGFFHHVSRHLSDRPKRFAIAWNMAGARVMRQLREGDTVIDLDVEGAFITQHSYVDYKWIAEGHVQARHPVNRIVTAYGRGVLQWFGVNGEVQGRGRQVGFSLEGGVRLNQRGPVMELFGGFERRVDADPLDRQAHNWALAGLRLVNR